MEDTLWLIALGILGVFLVNWAYDKVFKKPYSPSPEPFYSTPKREDCEKCGHTFRAASGRFLEGSGAWFCKEHTPKYDLRVQDYDDEEIHYFKNNVECDEEGNIISKNKK